MDNKELDHQQELQLLPSPHDHNSPPNSSSYTKYKPNIYFEAPSLDLQLSSCDQAEAVRWQASEQIRLAALEKEHVEHVKELTRREMEMASSEFLRARTMWERAKQEVEEAERLKLMATRWINPNCIEITCQSCRKKYQSSSI